MLSSYGSKHMGRGSNEMYKPVHASVDAAGCIIAADSGNNRVCLFSPNQLLMLRELITEKGNDNDYRLWQPYRVLIEPTSGRLYVGSNDGWILVFHVMHVLPTALRT